jgi:iron complex transport system ATP-binding protein
MPEIADAPVLQVTGVTYRRDKQVILDDIDWTVQPGENWVLFGPNSAGKTTLLKIITGYAWATSGQVQVLGETFGHTDITQLRKRIGWVSKSLEWLVHGDDPAIEIVLAGAFAGTVLWKESGPAEEARAMELLATFGLDGASERPYGVLSQGEQEKVLIARALMPEPALLILDEPCAGLDIASRERFLADVAVFAATTNISIIMVTHHIEEVDPAVFGRALVLKQGQVFATGQVEEIFTGDLLSALFGMLIELEQHNGRYFTRY